MTRSIRQYTLLLASTLLICALVASGQQVVTGGPPPEIRSHIEALVKAANSGSSDEWEKMAQAHFSPGELNRYSGGERKRVFENLRRDFGTISLGSVEGPDEPLRLHIKGSTGAGGVIELNLEQDAPYRIDNLRVKIGGADHDKSPSSIDAPPVSGNMSNTQLTSALDKYFATLVTNGVFPVTYWSLRMARPRTRSHTDSLTGPTKFRTIPRPGSILVQSTKLSRRQQSSN